MQRFGVEIHLIDKDLILLTFKRKMRMKKKMILLTMLVCPILIFGQAWDYPVKPGTEEWKSLKSHCEKISVCQIPNEILKNCSTEDLLEICLLAQSVRDNQEKC